MFSNFYAKNKIKNVLILFTIFAIINSMKRLIIVWLCGVKMCLSDPITYEEAKAFVEKFDGSHLEQIDKVFLQKNILKIMGVPSEKAQFLTVYNYLLTSKDTPLNKFYTLAQEKKSCCAKYKAIWEEIYDQAWKALLIKYKIDDKTLRDLVNNDLEDLEKYGFYSWGDRYDDDFDPDHIAKIEQQLKALKEGSVSTENTISESKSDTRKRLPAGDSFLEKKRVNSNFVSNQISDSF